LIDVGNSLRLMEKNERDASEKEEKLANRLSEMKGRYSEVGWTKGPFTTNCLISK